MLEASAVIGQANFELMKTFLLQLVGRLDIDRGNTRVSVVSYSADIVDSFKLGVHSSVTALQAAISSLRYSGGSTNTAEALKYIRTMILTSMAGAPIDVPKVVVTFTAGPSDDVRATQVY